MKKSLLFVIPSLTIGGTTVSTRNLISLLDKDKYNICVWPLNNEGELKQIYDDLPQIQTNFYARSLALRSKEGEKNSIKRVGVSVVRYLAHHSSKFRTFFIKKGVKKSIAAEMVFDTVISEQEGFTTEFASYIHAHNRLAWVRCDYKRYFETRGEKIESFYNKYDHIVCVAEQARNHFVEIYPNLKEKTTCIYNPQNSSWILEQSQKNDEDALFEKKGYTIVSVGRLSRVKRFIRIPQIASIIKSAGLDFKWFIIGDGEEKERIRQEIHRQGMEDLVIMLGVKNNPHFYIKNSDVYVCLSESEACPRVINEAKILGTPVVSSDFVTVYEYLQDHVDGIIAPIDNVGESIIELLSNESLYSRIKNKISEFSFDNTPLLRMIEELL